MRDFLVATVALKVHGRGETMGKGIAVDVGSHEAKEKASQKLALSIAIVKPSLARERVSCPYAGAVNGPLVRWM
jgi:hypothetical protein